MISGTRATCAIVAARLRRKSRTQRARAGCADGGQMRIAALGVPLFDNRIAYAYDLRGDRLSVTYPGGRKLASKYDAMDRLVTVPGMPGCDAKV